MNVPATIRLSISALLAFILTVALTPLNIIAQDADNASKAGDTVEPNQKGSTLQLGSFSNSLAVKNLKASKEFYEKLGFTEAGGNVEQNWLILRNGTTTIGLFQGMLEQNIMTFNPGWDENASKLTSFDDVRIIHSRVAKQTKATWC